MCSPTSVSRSSLFAVFGAFALVAVEASGAHAALMQGPKNPTTVISEACVAGAAWFPPGNAMASDDAYAQVSPAGVPTQCLKATGYGFNIPGPAQIKGIQVDIERHSSGGMMKDSSVKIVKAGTITGTDHADLITIWPSPNPVDDAVKTYGGPADLWGVGWTPGDINNVGFGASISAVDSGNTANVDVIKVTVFYDLCSAAPSGTCLTSLKSVFIVKDKGADSPKDKMIWKWIKGVSLTQTDFGDPTVNSTGATNALCVYENNVLIAETVVGPDNAKWSKISTKGYKYLDKPGTANGVNKIIQKASASAKSKILQKAKGVALPDIVVPPAGLTLPVDVQMVNSQSGLCFGSTFDIGDIKKNADGLFKAKAQ